MNYEDMVRNPERFVEFLIKLKSDPLTIQKFRERINIDPAYRMHVRRLAAANPYLAEIPEIKSFLNQNSHIKEKGRSK